MKTSALLSEAAASNEAMTTPPSRKRKAVDSKAGPERPSRRRATTPRRITRSRFKTMNENSSTPSILDPGLEVQPRRRRPLGGQRATAVATRPQDAATEAPTAPEQLENDSAPHSQTEKRVSEADVAAASQIAQAVLKAGLMAEFPTRSVGGTETSQGGDSITEQGPTHIIAGVVDNTEATRSLPTEPRSLAPLPSTLSPSIHGVDGEADNYHRGTDIEKSRPRTAVGTSRDQARAGADENEPTATNEWPEAREVAEAEEEVGSQGDTKRQQPTPWLPDKADNFRPRWGWYPSEQAQLQNKAPVADEDKPRAMPTPSFILSGGIGGEVESPVQNPNPGGLKSLLHWQPEANRISYATDVARVLSPWENQGVTGPLPPAMLQWEPTRYSVAGCDYSPEVFPADFEESEPEDFELEERDDDVDP